MAGLIACMGMTAQAQDTPQETPKGKAIIQVFGNFHTGIGHNNKELGFDLDRSYLGYEYNFGKGVSVKGVMDIGKPSSVDDYHRIAYIKNAAVQWKTGNLTLNGGLISTTQFNFQEKFWGHRYIMKSFQDEYKFGNSADLGISASYKFADWISADAIIVNGEGYKKIQVNNGLNYGLGVTLTPIKGFNIRLYGGVTESGLESTTETLNATIFMGYQCDHFTIGAEYNHAWNSSFIQDADRYGYSIYTTVGLSKVVSLYARYDDVFSTDNWNIAKDESSAILGAQIKLGKHVKVAPNVRMNIPKDNGATNSYAAYINCYFGI